MSIDARSKACPAADIGGQAVLEGVMMKSPDAIAVAVRRENGDVVVKREEYVSPAKKHKWMGLPFIRGSVDHGTAFDIAGKGIAGCISLIESTKVCVEYAVRKHYGTKK